MSGTCKRCTGHVGRRQNMSEGGGVRLSGLGHIGGSQYTSVRVKGVRACLAGVGTRGGHAGRVGAPGRVGGMFRRARMHQNASGRMSNGAGHIQVGPVRPWARAVAPGGCVGCVWGSSCASGCTGQRGQVGSASCGPGRAWGVGLACNGPACVGMRLGGTAARPKGSGGVGYVRRGGGTSRTRGVRRWGGARERWAVGTSSGGGCMPRGRGMPGEVRAARVHRAVAEAVASGTGASAAC